MKSEFKNSEVYKKMIFRFCNCEFDWKFMFFVISFMHKIVGTEIERDEFEKTKNSCIAISHQLRCPNSAWNIPYLRISDETT